MVGGTERFCTELAENLGEQVIGKTGAEGVYGITFHAKQLGAAIKTDDGKMGPQYFIAYDLVKKHTECSHPPFRSMFHHRLPTGTEKLQSMSKKSKKSRITPNK